MVLSTSFALYIYCSNNGTMQHIKTPSSLCRNSMEITSIAHLQLGVQLLCVRAGIL